MKNGINFLVYVIIALFVMFFAYCENEAAEPDTLVVASNPDSLSYDYFIWYDTNMNNAIFESGQSAYYFVNNPGLVEENSNYVNGDTTLSINRKHLDFDEGQFYQFDSFPGKTSKFNDILDVTYSEIESQSKGENWTVRFPTSKCRKNGSTVSNSTIEVVGNRVSVLGESFSVNEPSNYGPPSLASVLAQSINNPPSPPTSSQIDALPCEEIIGCYFNSRQISVLIDKTYSWTTNNNSYYWSRVYDIMFSHCWYFECPDGPAEREMVCIVDITEKYWKNNILLSSTSKAAIFARTY